jgi:CBS domain-containing protein
MHTQIVIYRYVTGDPALLARVLIEDVDDLVAGPAAAPAPDGTFLVPLHGRVLGLDMDKTVRVELGTVSLIGRCIRIPLSWRAEPLRHAFPAFHGALEFEPLARDLGQLVIVGEYTPPLGLAGAAVDATMLRRVAQRTAELLADQIVERLDRRASGEEAEIITPTAAADLRVADVMTADPVMFAEDMPVGTAARVLLHYEAGGAPVMAANGTLVGVLSERDLLDKEAAVRDERGRTAQDAQRRRSARTVGEACTRPARTTRPDVTLHAAAREMADHAVSRLVVVDGARVVGIITRHDVLKVFDRTDDELQRLAHAALEAQARALDDALDERAVVERIAVHATVEWGVVYLSGQVPRRSDANRLVASVAAVDGVIDVDAERLRYEVDDTAPLMYP